MSKRKTWLTLLAASGLGLASPLLAHHAATMFDRNQTVELTGEIVEFQWTSPHIWIEINVENEAGEIELWRVEFGSANSLYRRGWRPENLPVGSTVTVHGLPARDGSRSVEGDEVTLEDGTTLLSGTNRDE